MPDTHRPRLTALLIAIPLVLLAVVAACAGRQQPAARVGAPDVTHFTNLDVTGDATVGGSLDTAKLDVAGNAAIAGELSAETLVVNSGFETNAITATGMVTTALATVDYLTVRQAFTSTNFATADYLTVRKGLTTSALVVTDLVTFDRLIIDDLAANDTDLGHVTALTLALTGPATTGPLVVIGDAGIGGDLEIEGGLVVSDPVRTSSLLVAGDAGIGGDLELEGELVISDGAQVTQYLALSGPIYHPTAVITTNHNFNAAPYAYLTTNYSATAPIEIELPPAVAGLGYCFYAAEPVHLLTIDPADGDQIHLLTSAPGQAIQSSAPGDTICLLAVTEDLWIPYLRLGTWASPS